MRTLVLLLTITTSPALAGDFQKCADFLGVSDEDMARRSDDTAKDNRRYSYWITPGLSPRLRYFPFELTGDGEVVCNPHKVSRVSCDREQRDGATVDTIRFPIPRLLSLLANSTESILDRSDKPTKATMTITRGDDAMEILEGLHLTDEERAFFEDGHRVGVEGTVLADSTFLQEGARIRFQVMDGQCVPWESSQILSDKDDQTRKTEVVAFYFPACHALKQVMDALPALETVFDEEHNDSVTDVLMNYFGRFFRAREGFEELVDVTRAKGMFINSTRSRLRQTSAFPTFHALYANANWSTQEMRRAGFSPVIAGHTLLQSCYDQGLGPFLD